MRDGNFSTSDGFVNLHPTEEHIGFIISMKIFLGPYGCPSPKILKYYPVLPLKIMEIVFFI